MSVARLPRRESVLDGLDPAEALGQARRIVALELAGHCRRALDVTREALGRAPGDAYLLARVEVLTPLLAHFEAKAGQGGQGA